MMRALATALVLSAVAFPAPVDAHIGNHSVTVDANSFSPRELRVDPGETVVWNVLQDGHTITADGGAFDFRGAEGGTIPAGQTRQWETPAADLRVPYHCAVHVAMVGVLVIGDPPLPPPPPREPVEVRAVPGEYATIAAALKDIPARVRVEVAPGTYPVRGLTVLPAKGIDPRADVVIEVVGTGATPEDVVLEPAGSAAGAGLGIAADHVLVEGLSIDGFATGVAVDRAHDVAIVDVATSTTAYGVRAVGSTDLRLERVTATGASVAGIAIERCPVCDALVSGATLSGNLAGLATRDAGSVVVLGSVVTGNGVGVVLARDLAGGSVARGAHVLGNTIVGNDADLPAAGPIRAVNAGVWLDGAWSAVVEGNEISSQRWGVLATGLGGPILSGRVASNSLDVHAEADLAWDGLGAGLCFAGNDPATSAPAAIETLYPCDRAAPGIPYPLVTLAAMG